MCKPKSMAGVILLIQVSEIQSSNKKVLRAISSQKEELIFISMDTETCIECGDDMIYIVRVGSTTDKPVPYCQQCGFYGTNNEESELFHDVNEPGSSWGHRDGTVGESAPAGYKSILSINIRMLLIQAFFLFRMESIGKTDFPKLKLALYSS